MAPVAELMEVGTSAARAVVTVVDQVKQVIQIVEVEQAGMANREEAGSVEANSVEAHSVEADFHHQDAQNHGLFSLLYFHKSNIPEFLQPHPKNYL